eukprot:TRINITY_DN6950_c0_g2_i1.p1 TRINITY_DN6950_c0_g2~~TRINITY_DN6950_c0_g2_i1.p1  ORF type:complete len:339 (+),score=17.34 TRINITY_DN6950_c0_g2_i1:146-1162(+)
MLQLEYSWLLFLLPLPIAAWLLLPAYREPQRKLRVPFTLAFKPRIDPAARAVSGGRPLRALLLRWLTWGLLLAAAARPVYLAPPTVHIKPQRDLVLAIDLSQSMSRQDVAVSGLPDRERLAAVKLAARQFIDQRTDDRIGLVAFGDRAFTLAPPSPDHQVLQQILTTTESGMAGANTALGDAIGVTLKLLDDSDSPEKLLILLTDGNDNRSRLDPLEAARIADLRGLTIHTIGFGQSRTGENDAVNTDSLAQIASTTGGRFFRADDQAALAQVYQAIDTMTPHNAEHLKIQPRRELFWVPVLLVCLLLLAECLIALIPMLIRSLSRPPQPLANGSADQ